MSQFRKDQSQAIVSRLWYTTDSWYKKSGYTNTGFSYVWHLKPLTVKDGIDISNFGKEYQFNTASGADIRESDRLTIGGVVYDVKWVMTQEGVSFSRLIAIIQKWSK